MKKVIFYAFLMLIGQASWAQQFASMGGIWYNPLTTEMFAIDVEEVSNLIKGKGVYYGKGNTKMKLMQIMKQEPKEADNTYFLKTYDPANPNMAYELTSQMTPAGIIITFTRTGSRNKMEYFYLLSKLEYEIDVSYMNRATPATLFKDYSMNIKFVANGEPEKNLVFDFMATSPTTANSEVRYNNTTAQVKMNMITHEMTFTLAPFGKVTAKWKYEMGWSLDLIDANKKVVQSFEQLFE